MSGKTGIQWCDETVNVATGCDRVKKANGQSGCDNCYAFAWHDRIYAQHIKGQRPTAPKQYHVPFSASYKRPGTDTPQGVQLLPERLTDLLRMRTPRKVFLGSMTDMFHESIPDEYLEQVFGVLASTPHITYQILTKRPQRMRDWVRSHTHEGCVAAMLAAGITKGLSERQMHNAVERIGAGWPWPLPNVWLGTSVEDQEAADERIPLLLETPAAVRFLSCEPLLGPVVIDEYVRESIRVTDDFLDAPDGAIVDGLERVNTWWLRRDRLHWCIVGGESGPRAREMALPWAYMLMQQCKIAGIPVFVKQLGTVWAKEHHAKDHHGGTPEEWPEHLRIRQFPTEMEVQ